MGIHQTTAAVRVVLTFSLFVLASEVAAAPPGPAPELAPTDVVRMQLEALRADDASGAYRFASPDNRRLIGDASDFAAMLERRYADMLTQIAARVTLQKKEDGKAQVLAQLQQVDGQETAYVFFLSLQYTDDCDGCWMTDGVFPLQPQNDRPLYSI